MLDRLFSWLSGQAALQPQAAIKTTTNGTAIDLTSVGNGAVSLIFLVVAGVITDGTHTFSLQDSPDNVTWTNVNAPYTQTGASGAVFTSATVAGTVLKMSYLGNPNGASRYVRLVDTVTGAPVTGGFYAAVACLDSQSALPAV